MTDVDVIILDIDGGTMLDDCLASVAHQTYRPNRVIVLDNGSRTPLFARIGARDVEVIRSETNLGFAAGMNRAYAATSAAYVAVVNNDVVLDEAWLELLVRVLDSNARVAAVQSVLMRDRVTIDGAGIDLSDGTIRQIAHGRSIGDVLPEAWGVSATATLYRREACGSQLFAERFFAYYEDAELSARFRASGWELRVHPRPLATHRGSQSSHVLGTGARYLRTRNRYWLARLHPGTARIPALLLEDAKLLVRGRSSMRGLLDGLFGRL